MRGLETSVPEIGVGLSGGLLEGDLEYEDVLSVGVAKCQLFTRGLLSSLAGGLFRKLGGVVFANLAGGLPRVSVWVLSLDARGIVLRNLTGGLPRVRAWILSLVAKSCLVFIGVQLQMSSEPESLSEDSQSDPE